MWRRLLSSFLAGYNSGPLCGGRIQTPEEAEGTRRGSFDLNRIECLDRLFGPKIRELLDVPLSSTECGRSSLSRTSAPYH